MKIRNAESKDVPKISSLLDQLGYPLNLKTLEDKVVSLLNHPDHVLVVAEDDQVRAVIFIHFVPQLGLTGDFAIINYLSVDPDYRSKGVGKLLEEYCERLAKERGCERVQLHCSISRADAHRFYERQGYTESRKYFSKTLPK